MEEQQSYSDKKDKTEINDKMKDKLPVLFYHQLNEKMPGSQLTVGEILAKSL